MKGSESFQEKARRVLRPYRNIGSAVVDAWPLTPVGMALGVVAVVCLTAFGFEKLDLVLLVVGYGAGGLLLIALGAVAVGTVGLRLWLRRANFAWRLSSFETGTPVETGFSLPSLWWFPLVQTQWEWLAPKGAVTEQIAESGRSSERVELSRRGVVQAVTCLLYTSDAADE